MEAAYTLGTKDRSVVCRILLPAGAPDIAEVLRRALDWSCTYSSVTELIASSSGIGYRIINHQVLMATGQIIFSIIVTGIIRPYFRFRVQIAKSETFHLEALLMSKLVIKGFSRAHRDAKIDLVAHHRRVRWCV